MSFWYQRDACSNNRNSHRLKIAKPRLYGAGLLILSVGSVTAYAQEVTPPGIVARFDVVQRLEYSDNPDFEEDRVSDFYGRTIFGFGLESATRVSNFALSLGADLEEGRDSQSTFEWTNYNLDFAYDRTTRNAFLGFNLGFSEFDLNSSDFENDFEQDGNSINQNDGTRQSYNFGLEGAVGMEAPIGASFQWNNNEINYSGSDDPDLRDISTNNFSGQVDFRIDPRITASLTGRFDEFDASGDGVDRETTGFGTSISMDITPLDRVDVSLSYERIERSGGETGTDEGLSGGVDWTRQVPNGEMGISYRSDVASNNEGRRSFLNVFRDMEMLRGNLSVRLGLTGAETVGTDPLVDISYTHERPTSTLTFGLSQSVNTDDDNNEQINTTLRASLDQEINSLSSLQFDISYFNRNELQDNPNDGKRINLGLSYRHNLTRDWGLVTGYSHTFSAEETENDRRSNTVFVGLERSFDWRP